MIIPKLYCLCWESDWQQEMYADDLGCCKHCGKRMHKFYARTLLPQEKKKVIE